MSLALALALLAAGVLAGTIGTAGGITSLVSYPALLAAGLSARSADVANIVALVGCWPGAALASRRELAGWAPWLRTWLPVTGVGAVTGSVLLLATPSNVFRAVVPFLVLGGAATLVLQPRLAGHGQQRRTRPSTLILATGLLTTSLYGGYFGAGAGVMVLALLLLTVDRRLAVANALKNMHVGAASLASAALFIGFGPVAWSAVLPLGIGLFVGSLAGPRVVRRLPGAVVRWLAGLMAVALAVELWLH